MRYLRYAFLAILAIGLVTVAMANRDPVTLRLASDDIAALVGLSATITLPLFLVIFAGILVGVLVGFVWEWFREHKHRVELAVQRREKERLQKEVGRLRVAEPEPDDEVLALLERTG